MSLVRLVCVGMCSVFVIIMTEIGGDGNTYVAAIIVLLGTNDWDVE